MWVLVYGEWVVGWQGGLYSRERRGIEGLTVVISFGFGILAVVVALVAASAAAQISCGKDIKVILVMVLADFLIWNGVWLMMFVICLGRFFFVNAESWNEVCFDTKFDAGQP